MILDPSICGPLSPLLIFYHVPGLKCASLNFFGTSPVTSRGRIRKAALWSGFRCFWLLATHFVLRLKSQSVLRLPFFSSLVCTTAWCNSQQWPGYNQVLHDVHDTASSSAGYTVALDRSVDALHDYRRLALMPSSAYALGAVSYDHGDLPGDPLCAYAVQCRCECALFPSMDDSWNARLFMMQQVQKAYSGPDI